MGCSHGSGIDKFCWSSVAASGCVATVCAISTFFLFLQKFTKIRGKAQKVVSLAVCRIEAFFKKIANVH